MFADLFSGVRDDARVLGRFALIAYLLSGVIWDGAFRGFLAFFTGVGLHSLLGPERVRTYYFAPIALNVRVRFT